MRRIVIYTRVSSKKHEQSLSLENQRDHYSEWCKQNNYEMLHVYPEEGLTGTNARREQFLLMLFHAGIDCEENDDGMDIFRKSDREAQFDYIVVKDPSRFSRHSEIGMTVLKLLRDKKVFVIFENAGVSTKDTNWRTYLNMLFSIAESESENMSKRIKFARKLNADKGLYRPARLPYGYERNNEGEFVVNEEQKKVIRFIYDNYETQGSHILTTRLNEKGIPTQQGNKWSGDKILRIISNFIYTSTAVVNRSEKKNVTDVKRTDIPKKEWIKIPNAVPPIVTVEEWERVNEIRAKRVNKTTERGRRPSVNDLFYEKLFCSKCGSRYVRHIGYKDKITYICQNRRKGQGCDNKGIAFNVVNRALNKIDYYDVIQNERHMRKQVVIFNTILKNLGEFKNATSDIKLRLEHEKIEKLKEMEQVAERAIDGNLSETVIKAINKKAESIQNRINEIDKSLLNISIEKIDNLFTNLNSHAVAVANIGSDADVFRLLDRAIIYNKEIKFQFINTSFYNLISDFNDLAFGTEFAIDENKYLNSIGAVEIVVSR